MPQLLHALAHPLLPERCQRFQALIRISAWNVSDMRGWFQLVLGSRVETRPARVQAIHEKAADRIRTDDLLHGNYGGGLWIPTQKTPLAGTS